MKTDIFIIARSYINGNFTQMKEEIKSYGVKKFWHHILTQSYSESGIDLNNQDLARIAKILM